MTRIYVQFNQAQYSDKQLRESVQNILDHRSTLSMSTLKGHNSYINMAHFAYNSSLELFILTQPDTQHARNFDINPSVAAAIWCEPEVWGTDLQGLQLFGSCERVQKMQLADAITTYAQRFPEFGRQVKHPTDFARGVTDSRLYVIRVHQLKLLDEPQFGRRNFLMLDVQA